MIFTRIWYIIPPQLVWFSSLTGLFETLAPCESVKNIVQNSSRNIIAGWAYPVH
jgi:hypothetical protein